MSKVAQINRFPYLEQGTEEWLAARADCLCTGSEFAAALGLCPYTSRAQLIKRKIGLSAPVETNDYMRFGTEMEPHVAAAYDSAYGVNSATFGFVTYELGGVKVGCSPDRVLLDTQGQPTHLIEIKCSVRERFTVEPYHLPQLLAQTVMMGIPVVDYVCWTPSQVDEQGNMLLNVATVTFDERLWTNHVWPALRQFKSMVDRKITCRVNSAEKRELEQAFAKYTTISSRQCT